MTGGTGTVAAEQSRMVLNTDDFGADEHRQALSFWQQIATEEELQGCNALEKLLVGCEIIAALDGVDLLLV
jgi:hypothetical protein